MDYTKLTTQEIEDKSINKLKVHLQTLFVCRDYAAVDIDLHNTRTDKGIDMIYDVSDRTNKRHLIRVNVQVKASINEMQPLKSGKNKGLISQQLETRHIRYYTIDLETPTIIFLYDLKVEKIYWYNSVLKSAELNKRANEIDIEFSSGEREGQSIQIYVDPQNCIYSSGNYIENSFDKLMGEMQVALAILSSRRSYEWRKSLSLKLRSHQEYCGDLNLGVLNSLLAYCKKTQGVLVQPYRIIENIFSNNKSGRISKGYLFNASPEIFNVFKAITYNDGKYEISEKLVIMEDDIQDIVKDIVYLMLCNGVEHLTKEQYSYSAKVCIHNLQPIPEKKCGCPKCLYYRLDIAQMFTVLESGEIEHVDGTHNMSFTYFLLSDYDKAFEILMKQKDLYKQEEKFVSYAKALYNLSQLEELLKDYSFQSITDAPKFKEIDLDYEVESLKISHEKILSAEEAYIMEWLVKEKFLHEISSGIDDLTFKIEQCYSRDRNRGMSQNSLAYTLREVCLRFVNLIRVNELFYADSFNLQQIAFKLFNCCVAFCSIRSEDSSKLENLSETDLELAIFYCNSEQIKHVLDKYEYAIKKIPCAEGVIQKTILGKLLNLKASVDKIPTDDNAPNSLWNKIEQYLANIFILASRLQFSKGEIATFLESSLSIYKDASSLRRCFEKNFITFLDLQSMFMDEQQLENLLGIFLALDFYGVDQYLEVLLKRLKKNDPSYKIQQEMYPIARSKLIQFNSPGIGHLTVLFESLSAKEQDEVRLRIINALNKEFDAQFYFMVSIYQIIDHKLFWERYTEYVLPRISFPIDNDRPFSKKGINEWLNEYLNIAFTFNKTEAINKIRILAAGNNDYYQWIIDPDDFDYSYFKINWLQIYPVISFTERLAQSTKLKAVLLNSIDEDFDKQTALYYINNFTKTHGDK